MAVDDLHEVSPFLFKIQTSMDQADVRKYI